MIEQSKSEYIRELCPECDGNGCYIEYYCTNIDSNSTTPIKSIITCLECNGRGYIDHRITLQNSGIYGRILAEH